MPQNLQSVMQSVRRKAEEQAKARLVAQLRSVGEECVSEAVANGNYTDRTGNLRGSIGYVVADDGEVLEEGGFRSFGGPEGPASGRMKALEKCQGTRGVVLVIVAGMSYAQYVADKGFNVLDSAEILAKQLINQLGRG